MKGKKEERIKGKMETEKEERRKEEDERAKGKR